MDSIRLKDIIVVDDRFKNSINLQLDLYKTDKVESYIPTKSSLNILNSYFLNVLNNKDKATVLIGPYGKGKSHLLLVLLSVLRLERDECNSKLIGILNKSFQNVDADVAANMIDIWKNKKKILPIIISSTQGDLNQAFLLGLNEALINADLSDIVPVTHYTEAVKVIEKWKTDFEYTYGKFLLKLKEKNITIKDFIARLYLCERSALEVFKKIYPELTSGSIFNPLINVEILNLYKNVNDIICNEYGYNGIYIIFDEFSKFIESHDKTTVANDMKILQDVCELSADSGNNQIHITLVAHKSIKEYGDVLPIGVINAFTGIEGRIRENYFISSSKNNYELLKNVIRKDEVKFQILCEQLDDLSQSTTERYYNISSLRSLFPYDDFKEILVRGCFPLTPISSYVLLNISEKVAQNERTLFTFASKDEPFSMANYILNHDIGMPWVIGTDLIYDYFKAIFKKDVSNYIVHNEWLKAEYALSQISDSKCKNIIKTLALINIINKFDEMPPNDEVLSSATCLGNQGIEIIDKLVTRQLIHKKTSTGYYVFKSGIGADIKAEINKERVIIGDNFDLCRGILRATGTEYVLPKQYNQEYSMTRYFATKYMLYDDFMRLSHSEYLFEECFADGYIIKLIINSDDLTNNEMIIENKLVEIADNRLIVLLPKKAYDIRTYVRDFIILQKFKENKNFIEENKVLYNELELFEDDMVFSIESMLSNSFDAQNGKCYIFSLLGGSTSKKERVDLNRIVSGVCNQIYHSTPIINNEMINKREIISPAIKKARKVIIDYILRGEIEEAFYRGTSPEATIFRSVMLNTGVYNGNVNEAMSNIIMEINQFIDRSENAKQSFLSLFNRLQEAPYGLRMGVIPIIMTYVLTERNEDIIVCLKNREVELSSDTILNICEKPSDYTIYVEQGTAEKKEYIKGLATLFKVQEVKKNNVISPTIVLQEMQRWIKALPQIVRGLRDIQIEANTTLKNHTVIILKSSLQKPDLNPYEFLFKDIIRILELENYEDAIQNIAIIKNYLDSYTERFIEELIVNTKKAFSGRVEDNLSSILLSWYEDQSQQAKQGLFSDQISGLLNFVRTLNSYDESVVIKKIAKIISGLHIENWNDESKDKYIEGLKAVRNEIENIQDRNASDYGKFRLTFIDSSGSEVVKYYEGISENTAYMLKNVISEAIDEFGESISMNDKVAVLIEMLEKVLK